MAPKAPGNPLLVSTVLYSLSLIKCSRYIIYIYIFSTNIDIPSHFSSSPKSQTKDGEEEKEQEGSGGVFITEHSNLSTEMSVKSRRSKESRVTIKTPPTSECTLHAATTVS